jgi:hypothetical protein
MKDATQLAIEITALTKSGGPLTKRIRLAADGSITSDGSECVMARGVARRVPIGDVKELAALLDNITSNQAIALGALRPDLPGEVGVITKHKLNGNARSDVIARTGSDILYRKGQPALTPLAASGPR